MRSVVEIMVGVLYLVGAGFNLVYTLRHAESFYTDFVKGAWLPPARRFVASLVVPNGVVFTLAVVAFQVAVGVAILSRGSAATSALVVGAVFAVVVSLFSSPGGTVGNLALAAIQLVLAGAR